MLTHRHGPARAVFFRSGRAVLYPEAAGLAAGWQTYYEEMVTVSDAGVTWLTQDAYNRLKQELDELIENRPVIAAKINASREEGDLKENGGDDRAPGGAAHHEGRIRRHDARLLRGT